MTFKVGDKVVQVLEPETELTVEKVYYQDWCDTWRIHASGADGGAWYADEEDFRHVFEYEDVIVSKWGRPEGVAVYCDKRTGFAVFDKRAYEAWITENGL